MHLHHDYHQEMSRFRKAVRFLSVLLVTNAFNFGGSAQTAGKADIAYAESDVVRPKLIHREEPTYSVTALQARIQGDILIAATIDVSGAPRDPMVLSPLGEGLNEQALKCLSNWRFVPARRNGRPIDFRATIQINFRIAGKPFDARAERRRVGATAVATLLSRQEDGKPSKDSVGIMRSLAGHGWEQAEYVVGLWQVTGDVLPKDDISGLKTIRSAADKGYPVAMVFMGDALIDGKGMPQNVKKGLTYLRKAVAVGSIDAEQDLGKRYMDGKGLDVDVAEARKYLDLCAQAGRPDCQTLVGQLPKKAR